MLCASRRGASLASTRQTNQARATTEGKTAVKTPKMNKDTIAAPLAPKKLYWNIVLIWALFELLCEESCEFLWTGWMFSLSEKAIFERHRQK